MQRVIIEGSVWRHHNGNTYTVVAVFNSDSDREEYPATVGYQGKNGKLWAKTMDIFLRSMTPCNE